MTKILFIFLLAIINTNLIQASEDELEEEANDIPQAEKDRLIEIIENYFTTHSMQVIHKFSDNNNCPSNPNTVSQLSPLCKKEYGSGYIDATKHYFKSKNLCSPSFCNTFITTIQSGILNCNYENLETHSTQCLEKDVHYATNKESSSGTRPESKKRALCQCLFNNINNRYVIFLLNEDDEYRGVINYLKFKDVILDPATNKITTDNIYTSKNPVSNTWGSYPGFYMRSTSSNETQLLGAKAGNELGYVKFIRNKSPEEFSTCNVGIVKLVNK